MKNRIYYKYLSLRERKNKLSKKTIKFFFRNLIGGYTDNINSVRINPNKKIFISGKGKIGKTNFNVKLKKTS